MSCATLSKSNHDGKYIYSTALCLDRENFSDRENSLDRENFFLPFEELSPDRENKKIQMRKGPKIIESAFRVR